MNAAATNCIDLECERAGRWIGGCKFEGRYHVTIPVKDMERLGVLVDIMSEDQIQALATETYVCDVCVRCGRMVKP